jgi:elongation factor P
VYSVSDFRRGLAIIVENEPFRVIEYNHFKMGRGNAKIRTKLKHIKTGAVLERVFTSNDIFKPPDLENRKMQFLYEATGELTFMDISTFDQVAIAATNFGDVRYFLVENQEYMLHFLDNEAIDIDIPASVVVEVIETEPVVRGDTVSNVTKPAKIKGGLEVRVPPFVKEGDLIKIDTRTAEYLERAN